ncbi:MULTISPECIES: DUF4388 domain-containing protein [Trichocoleus]|uniref:DUF4388 domain-containing protein n=1 Tax=Trichocoleus desertorum GB2-A4 TaxID=2933944 RepID=A0ABV0J777_9CYAN|nr:MULTISPECIES: DUF4388 domain-containing protein [unclassified Trichocoleus]MBD1862595.1 DUF4388 domain-containing protein [Trichocoleus sp. FACHB-46]MBD2093891.1 DUF4388 domain-containing protein [Trichocoleus sp. FACHB-591]MBD2121703.1 DUF4388 domain-containing protein [Trichocoleus sp. FACHB-262]
MTLASSLTDFSLAELFRMIDQGRKSGRLTLLIAGDAPTSQAPVCRYIWFRQGRVIAAADRLDGQGLISQITTRGWLSQRVIERLGNLAGGETPLGLTLKTQGALQAEQLNLLFSAQMQQIWSLFGIQTGRFDLDGKATLPSTEMTGLSLPAMEVALAGLRAMKDWTTLTDVLPEANSAIQSIIPGKPQFRLNPVESQIWEFASGSVSLNAIAKQLNQPVAKVQQAAFRLMLAGLVEELPLITSGSNVKGPPIVLDPIEQFPEEPKKTETAEKSKVSNSFLQNLVGFLRSKS